MLIPRKKDEKMMNPQSRMKPTFRWSLCALLGCALAGLLAGCERTEADPRGEGDGLNPSALHVGLVGDQTIEDLFTIPDANETEPAARAIRAAHLSLMEKYNIQVSPEEVKTFTQQSMDQLMSETEFEELRSRMETHLTQLDEIVQKGANLGNALDQFLQALGVTDSNLPQIGQVSVNTVSELRRLMPASREVLIQNNIMGNRDLVEMIKVAQIIIPEIQRQSQLLRLDEDYKKALLQYARENLLGKDPALDGIQPEDLQWPEP